MRTGEGNNNWRGGRHGGTDGYVRVLVPEHPRAHNGYVLEHLLVAERALGHFLPRTADVHHCNEVRSDNRPENLVICEDRTYHRLLHQRLRAYRATGDPAARQCHGCHLWVKQDEARFSANRGRYRRAWHPACLQAHEHNRYLRRKAKP